MTASRHTRMEATGPIWENTSNSWASVTSRSRSPTYRLELWVAAAAAAGAAAAERGRRWGRAAGA